MRKFVEPDVADNPLYHDTWKLLKKYRDVVWSLELSVQHVRTKFEIEYGTSIEDFLDSVYLAGADLAGSDIEHHAKCIERSHKMLKLLDSENPRWRCYTQSQTWCGHAGQKAPDSTQHPGIFSAVSRYHGTGDYQQHQVQQIFSFQVPPIFVLLKGSECKFKSGD